MNSNSPKISSEDLLDFTEQREDNLTDASKTLRIANYLGDLIFTAIVGLIALRLFGSVDEELTINDTAIIQIGYLGLYLFIQTGFESLTGKTPTKFLTRTHVVMQDGKKPGIGAICLRNLIRLIPFEPLSFLAKTGWHDTISKTRVVLD